MQHKVRLLKELWSLGLVPAAFAAFVLWNGGIVVGDKDNHQPAVHLVQPLYFVFFSACALAPVHWDLGRWVGGCVYTRACVCTRVYVCEGVPPTCSS